MAEALKGLSGTDDIIIYDKGPEHHVLHVKQFLQHCKDKKYQQGQMELLITFAVFQLSSQGYQLDPSITIVITSPTYHTNRIATGLLNQLSSSTDTIAELLAPP